VSLPFLLAHAGPGSTWQSMVVVAGVVLTGFVVAAGLGLVEVECADDLVVPLASTAIVSSLGTIAHEIVSDGIGWALPLAVVSLLALIVGALTRLDLRFPSPLPMGAIALGGVGAVVLYAPLTIALHPPPELLPLSDDSSIMIVEPADGGTVEGPVEVTVEVMGGSLGPGRVPLEELPEDPEEAGTLSIAIEEVRDDDAVTQQQLLEAEYAEVCTVSEPCERVSFALDPSPGTYELTIEFIRGDGVPLAPFVRDRITVTVE
jgi:uncharacterized membrane protein (UPF0136 family)